MSHRTCMLSVTLWPLEITIIDGVPDLSQEGPVCRGLPTIERSTETLICLCTNPQSIRI